MFDKRNGVFAVRIPRVLSLVLVVVMLLTCCLHAAPLSVIAQTTDPTIVVSEVIASAGGTAKVTVGLQNNPGIISMQLQMNYNTDLLTLTNVTDAGVLGNVFHNPTYDSPYVLSWVNDIAPANFTVNGTVATLEFAVSDGVPVGTVIPVEVTYNYNNYDIYNFNAQPVQFAIDNGSIAVQHIDADGKWETDADQHYHTCSCGTKFDVSNHNGGTATCNAQAVCSVCKVAYGGLNPSNHVGETQVKNKVAVTCSTNGYTGDIWCLDCNTKISGGMIIQALGYHVDGNGDRVCDLCDEDIPVSVLYGDVDEDGMITAIDALKVLRAVVGKDTLTENQIAAGDVDGNGTANAVDALLILKRIVNKIDKFPVE